MSANKITFILLSLLNLSLFTGCASKDSVAFKMERSVIPTSYSTPAIQDATDKKVTVYGVTINDKFDSRAVTKRYHIDKDGDIVFETQEGADDNIRSARMKLESTTKIVKEVIFLTSTGPGVDCLGTKSAFLNSFYEQYGGEMQDDATYRDNGHLFGTKTRLLKSSGFLDLGDIAIEATCDATSQDILGSPTLLVHSGKISIATKSHIYGPILSILDIHTKRISTIRPSIREEKSRLSGIASGTGFFISESGHLLTNEHIIQGAKRIYVLINGNKVEASLIDSDKDNDIALLQIKHATRPLALQMERSQAGSEVTVIGYPNIKVQGNEKKSTFGYINALSGLRGDPRQYQISAPTQPGNSGSPLINEQAEVIGIVVSTIDQSAMLQQTGILPQNVNYAVKIKQALAMLHQHDVPYRVAERSEQRSKTELIRDTSDSVVLVMSEM